VETPKQWHSIWRNIRYIIGFGYDPDELHETRIIGLVGLIASCKRKGSNRIKPPSSHSGLLILADVEHLTSIGKMGLTVQVGRRHGLGTEHKGLQNMQATSSLQILTSKCESVTKAANTAVK
jgi:hypothetical protein